MHTASHLSHAADPGNARPARADTAARDSQAEPQPSSPDEAGLLEREDHVERISDLLDVTLSGRGALLSIVGAPGEGKTALLEQTCALAADRGIAVWRACGSDLEREFALGAVRQLLEPPIHALDPRTRRRLTRGAGGLGAMALELVPAQERPPSRVAALHGLYWLLAGLVERRPALLAIDDAHWLDLVSLEWLAYLRARIDGIAALAVIATRPPDREARHGPLGMLVGDPRVNSLRVGALSEQAVARLVERTLDSTLHRSAQEGSAPVRARLEPRPCAGDKSTEGQSGFAVACHRATAGNPLALHELLAELVRRNMAPSAHAVAELGGSAPGALARNVQLRLARLQPAAGELARSLAVLGGRATLSQAAALAGLELARARRTVEALNGEGIVEEGPGPRVGFVHPLLMAAVYDDMPRSLRAGMHTAAAALLRAAHAEPEAVAAHLLQAEPASDPYSVSSLRAAAAAAMRKGAPAAAVTYLTRALAEPPPERQRGEALLELARAEFVLRSPTAAEHLRAAIDASPKPSDRASLRSMLADVLFFEGEWDGALALLRQAAADARTAGEENAALRVDGRLLALRTLDVRGGGMSEPERKRLLALTRSDLPEARPLCLNLALMLALHGDPPPRLERLVLRGLDDGRFLASESADAIEAVHAAFALILAERLDLALDFTEQMLADAAARGSVLGFLAGSSFKALAHLRAGALADAEADLAGTLELAEEQGLHFTIPFTASYLALTVQELGRSEQAAMVLEGVPLAGPLAGTPAGITLLEARGRVRRICGRGSEAISDLRACGEACRAIGVRNPNVAAWRSELALALAADSPIEARALAQEQLELARSARTPRAAGLALRALGSIAPRGKRDAALTEAVSVLEGAQAPLELAHALVDLGANLRRDGHRSQSREPLRRGLDLAHRCGASPLAERAREELLAAGARPRRPWLSGVQSLTASELRVARMAAAGATNREIAQTLFVTTQTVKGHLSSVYRKLGVSARAALTGAFADET